MLNRNFTANGPYQLWVADITYVPTWAGFIYLAVVLDAWNCRIIGWLMSTSLETTVALDALNMPAEQRKPAGAILRSDNGCRN